MTPPQNYAQLNKESWNQRTEVHVKSDFYDMPSFLKGQSSLNEIELHLLGDLKGKKVLHLQCHFGQDTISLAKLGASVTGVDISDKAIDFATDLAQKMDIDAHFICCNIYDLPQHLDEQFDVVFTSYGTIGWLPDINQWGQLIAQYLKPKGKFVFAEFHPVVWMFDDNFTKISYDYFNTGPIVETEEGTYADKTAAITLEYITWNHSLGSVVNSLIQSGINILSLEEFDYSPYACFDATEEFEPKKYRIKHLEKKIPMVYAIHGEKK